MPEINSDSSANSEIYKNPYDDPLFLSTSDHPNMKLVHTEFNGKNFNNWSRGVMLSLGSKNKEGFLDGSITMPELNSDKFKAWLRCDYMIRCWLLHSLTQEIKESFLNAKSAKQMWSDIVETYGQSNAPLQYQLKKELRNISLDNGSVAEYYNKLKRRWDEIDEIDAFPECKCGALQKCSCNILKKILDSASKDKVMMFLMGLGDSYENLRQNVLAMDPLPTINKVYSFVQQIESQKSILIVNQTAQDASALAANKTGNGKAVWNVWKRDANANANPKKAKVDERWCPKCKKGGHVIENCWVLNEDQRLSYFNRHGNGNSGSKYKKNKPYYTQYSTANNADMQEDTPLEVEYDRGGHFKNIEQGASSKGNPKVDQDLDNAVCTQVLNVMQSKFTESMDYSSASANYAGP